MNAQTNNTRRGFTIIEVVLVLAIAGLIFLMVFVALPALQRNQRDQARKGDVGLVATAVTNYTSNNRGSYPGTTALKDALGAADSSATETTFSELSTNIKNVTVHSSTSGSVDSSVDDGVITVYKGRKCGVVSADGGFTLTSGTAREFAVVTRLEASKNTAFCQGS